MLKKILTCALTLALLLAMLGAFTSCGEKVRYDGEDEFTMGGFSTEETVTSIEILWVKGSVTIAGSLGNKVSVKENYKHRNDNTLRYRLADGVLQIYPCASGTDAEEVAKDLTVELPYAMAYALENVKIVAKGDVAVGMNMIETKTLNVTAEAGNVHYKGRLHKATVTTASGDFSADSMTAEEIRFTSDTGDATLALHLFGFTAVMQDERGTFASTYEAYKNGGIYTYGTQASTLIFATDGKVTLTDVD